MYDGLFLVCKQIPFMQVCRAQCSLECSVEANVTVSLRFKFYCFFVYVECIDELTYFVLHETALEHFFLLLFNIHLKF